MMILSVPGKPLPDTSGSFCNTKNTWILLCAFPNATLEYTCKLFFLSFSFLEIEFSNLSNALKHAKEFKNQPSQMILLTLCQGHSELHGIQAS